MPSIRLNGCSIRFVLGTLHIGGAERQAFKLACRLRDQGATVSFWGFNTPGPLSNWCDAEKIPWRLLQAPWPQFSRHYFLWLLRFARMLRSDRADMLLPFTAAPNIACSLVWRFAGARSCVWNQRDEGRHLPDNLMTRMALRQASMFISNSTHAAEFLANNFKIPSKKQRVIFNAITLPEPAQGREAWRLKLGALPDTIVACMPANLTEFKDHVTLLDAWKIVVEESRATGAPPLLALAGRPGKTAEALRAQARDLDIEHNVKFLGVVEDISGLLHAADLGVFSSITEGSPNGVLECMAAGLAVAATDIPGIREAVGTEGAERLVPQKDAAAMAQAILHLMREQEQRKELGRNLQQRAQSEFAPEKINQEWLEAIGLLLNTKPE